MSFAFSIVPKVTNVKPGFTKVWVAPRDFFATLEEPVGSGAPGVTMEIATEHTFAALKGWLPLAVKIGGAKLTGTGEGEIGSRREKWTLEAKVSGLTSKQLEMFVNMLNEDMIVVMQDAQCPDAGVWQLGCDCDPATMNWNFDSGVSRGTNPKEHTVTFEATCDLVKYNFDPSTKELGWND